jgi:hypothetical protein
VQCKPLKGATARSLRVTRRLVGEAVRVVETATANGVAATIASKSVRVR